jgi:pimeloyl-ACP methyl ester carboxylesterase
MKGIRFTMFVLFSVTTAVAQQIPVKTLDIMLKDYEYPFQVKFLTLNSQQQELQMAYMDVLPQTPNGKVVVLMHGKNFNGAYWKTTASALSEKGYRVIIPDQVGFGKSSKPERYQYTFQQLASNTRTLLDSLDVSSATILGHSMGGMLATRFALMFPDITQKLVLVNPIGLEDWKLKIPYQGLEKWYQNEMKQNYESIKKYQLQNYYDGKWRKEYDEWLNLLAGWTTSPEYPIIAWSSALTHDMIYTQPVLYEFPLVKARTLLIIGQSDRTAPGKNLVSEDVAKTLGNYPILGRETRKKMLNAELVELHNVGHLPHIEAFDRFIKPLLAFLEK